MPIEITDMDAPLSRQARASSNSFRIFHERSWQTNLFFILSLTTITALPVDAVSAAETVEGQCRRLCTTVMDRHAHRCADMQCLKQAEAAYTGCLSSCVAKPVQETESKSFDVRKGT